jgi:hypothetical protein
MTIPRRRARTEGTARYRRSDRNGLYVGLIPYLQFIKLTETALKGGY